jgi:SAM-dependent methyltransferase
MNDNPRVNGLPEPFNFYRLVLQGDHLHFGFWPDDAPDLTLEQAQDHMFESLLAYFPAPPARVLDVGCGLGLSAHYLARRGYRVTSIAPSEALIDYARENHGAPGTDFLVADFLEENEAIFGAQHYDVVLFQESLQYLRPLEKVFDKAARLLRPKGTIIIGDEMCLDLSIRQQTAVHPRKEIVTKLLESGFCITEDRDIGRHVSRTCENVIGKFTESFGKIVSCVNQADTGAKLRFFLDGWKSQDRWYKEGALGYGILVARKDELMVRGYQPGDEDKILPLFNTVFHARRSLAHWYWKFRDNPFGSCKIAAAFTREGDLTAQYCGYPVPVYSSCTPVSTFWTFQAGDTMTNPVARNLGWGKTSVLNRIAVYFYNQYCRDNVPFIYGFNTGNIRKFGERFLQYEYLSHVPLYKKDVDEQPSRLKNGLLSNLWRGLSVQEVIDLSEPDELDRFFERVSDDYGILIKRTGAYLKWRYLDCPDGLYKLFAVRRFGKLIGWSVFAPRDCHLIWGDALFDRRYAHYAGPMLDHLRHHYYPGTAAIEGWFSSNPEWWAMLLKELGFAPQGEPNELAPALKIFDHRQFSAELLERRFYYTLGDSDLF